MFAWAGTPKPQYQPRFFRPLPRVCLGRILRIYHFQFLASIRNLKEKFLKIISRLKSWIFLWIWNMVTVILVTSWWKIKNKKNLRIRPKHVFEFKLSSETKFTLFHVKTIIRYKLWTNIISSVIFSAKNVILLSCDHKPLMQRFEFICTQNTFLKKFQWLPVTSGPWIRITLIHIWIN